MARLPKDQRSSMVQAAAAEIAGGLRILELYVENIKRVKVARIKPTHNVVVVAGKNGQGKSSVLDAIDWALTGTSNVPTLPIRKGQRHATVKVNLGDFIVHRQFSFIDPDKSAERNTYLTKLTITGKRGEQYPSPQILLNALLGKISFDPLAFLRMKDVEQVEALRGLVTFDVDIDALEAKQKEDYDERRVAGRGVDQAKAQLAGLSEPPAELPTETIDTNAITARIQQATLHNEAVAKARRNKEGVLQMAEQMIARVREQRDLALDMLLKTVEGDGAVITYDITVPAPMGGKAGELLARAEEIVIGEPIDVAELTAELSQANLTNQAIQRAAKYRETEENLAQAETLWKEIDERMKARAAERDAAIARAKMPIDGLSIDFDQIMYNGLPLSQASNAEQIRVSMALGMASNPKLRVLRIVDGSLLDSDSLELIAKAAEEHNFQVWIERVETDGKVSVVMEEGEASGEDVVNVEEKKA